jgi:Spy/CpxP family protein refolding chaperone
VLRRRASEISVSRVEITAQHACVTAGRSNASGARYTMNPPSRTAAVLAAAAAALCLTSGALAQDRAGPPAMGHAPHHDGDHAGWRKAHQERRARFLRDVLNIRQDQEPALQAFLADVRGSKGEHEGGADRPVEAGPLTTPERLDRMAAWMNKRQAERQAAFQHRAEAIRRFYAVLSPEQKRAFDALHSRGGMMRQGHRGLEGHGDGPRGGESDAG